MRFTKLSSNAFRETTPLIFFHLDVLPIRLGVCTKFQESSSICRPFCSLFKFRCHYALPPPLSSKCMKTVHHINKLLKIVGTFRKIN